MRQTTCFARRGTGCDCLIVKRCPGYRRCPFYKGNVQYQADIQLAYMHLRQMGPEAQHAIADQYYDGEMPWAIHDCEEYPPEKALAF